MSGSGYGMLTAAPPQLRLPTPWEQQASPYETRPRFEDPVDPGRMPYSVPVPLPVGFTRIGSGQVAPPFLPPSLPGSDGPGAPELGMGDYAGAGVRGFVLPHLFGGVAAGAFAAYAVRGTGLAGPAFAGKVAAGAIGGVVAGAATGAIVSMTDPQPGDSLATRYGVTGAILGGLSGAATSSAGFLPVGIALGAATGAIIGHNTGRNLQPRLDATA